MKKYLQNLWLAIINSPLLIPTQQTNFYQKSWSIMPFIKRFGSTDLLEIVNSRLNNTDVSIRHLSGDMIHYRVQQFGVVIMGTPTKANLKQFVRTLNELVEKRVIEYGCIGEPILMELAVLSPVNRYMLVFMAHSKLSPTQLKAATPLYSMEGSIPEQEYDGINPYKDFMFGEKQRVDILPMMETVRLRKQVKDMYNHEKDLNQSLEEKRQKINYLEGLLTERTQNDLRKIA